MLQLTLQKRKPGKKKKKVSTYGVRLLAVLATLSGCAASHPPMIPICIGDGYGGAYCDIPNVGKEWWPPSRLNNMWMTTQEGMSKFAMWCYMENGPKPYNSAGELHFLESLGLRNP